jgi:histidinol-phosphate aminotransferase
MSFSDFVPANIQAIQPYKPGKPLEEVERELGIKAVKMASNENPLGPSSKALESVRHYLEHIELYPDDTGYYLRQKLASRLSVSMDEIILGSGSSDILAMAFNSMLTNDTEVLTSEGSFIVYYLLGQAKGCAMVRTPMREFGFDLKAMLDRVTPKTRLVIIANPNNPTGTIVRRRELEEFLGKMPEHALVIMDEAYFEYVGDADYPDSFKYFREGKNVLIIRTFSKAYGLAGLRIGYGIARSEIIDTLQKVRMAFNTGSLGQVAALAALDDQAHVQRTVESNRREMEFLYRASKDVDAAMLKQGVIIRPMAGWGFPTMIRVSIGTHEQNEKFLRALDTVR